MLYAIIAWDKPGSHELRQATRADHLQFLHDLGDRLKAAGPFRDDHGLACGSLIILEAEDRASAEAVADSDPYAAAGLFDRVEISAWTWGLKNPEKS